VDNRTGPGQGHTTLVAMTPSSRPAPVVPGYRIGELIGRGSSGTVWAASPESTDRDLAVKVIPVASEEEGAAVAVELSALAAAARRGDAHLAGAHDVVAVTEPDPAVAIVMDRLRGGTLGRLVATRGHLTAGEVVTLLTPVALTVAGLHEGAIVHGDLAPSNIGFDDLGRPVVLDLGVSRVMGAPREEVYGTPGFVAPEVVAGGSPAVASDIYAIGALGWFALVGQPPPIPGERPDLAELRPDVPGELVRIIERALHADPSARGEGQQLATAVYAAAPAAAIVPGEGDDPATMLTHRVRQLAHGRSPDDGRSRAEDGSRRAHRDALRHRSHHGHLRVATTIAAAVVLLVGGATVAALGRDGGPDGPPVAPARSSATWTEPATDAASTSGPPASTPASAAPLPEEILSTVVAARARAWSSGEVGGLSDVFVSGSPALGHDEALLAEAVRAGHTYESLEFAVTDVQPLVESVDRLRIEVTIATSAYAVRTDAGDGGSTDAGDEGSTDGAPVEVRQPGDTPPRASSVVERGPTSARVVVTLSLGPQGWRIAELEPASSGEASPG
jgi:eukaryotic-like serine/threonine-protein kinase